MGQDSSKRLLFEAMHKVTGMPLREDMYTDDQVTQNSDSENDKFSNIEPKEKRLLLRFINQIMFKVPKPELNDFFGMIIEFENPENSIDELKMALEKYNSLIKPITRPYWTDRLFDLLSRKKELLSKYNIADSFMQLHYDDMEYEMGYPDYNFNNDTDAIGEDVGMSMNGNQQNVPYERMSKEQKQRFWDERISKIMAANTLEDVIQTYSPENPLNITQKDVNVKYGGLGKFKKTLIDNLKNSRNFKAAFSTGLEENGDFDNPANNFTQPLESFFTMPPHMSLDDQIAFIDYSIGKLQELQNQLGGEQEDLDIKAGEYRDRNPQRFN